MLRRNFLALTGLAGAGALHAWDTLPACSYPVAFPANPINGPIETNELIDVPGGDPIKRPLWSKLSPLEQNLLAAKMKVAYDRMATRKPADTLGLLYQAWQHAWNCGARVDHYPDVHAGPDFLPWHRAFLYVHERLLQAELGGDRTFRIPVWDWENDPEVPWVYHFLRGVKGPCNAPRNNSLPPITKQGISSWLLSDSFNQFVSGQAYSGIHSFVHHNLGDASYMMDPATAAADPVFYAHHANVDRYWIYWWNYYKNQFQASWPNSHYCFYGPKGRPVRMEIGDLQDTVKLGYTYDPPEGGLLYQPDPVTALPNPNSGFLTFADKEWDKLISYLQELLQISSPIDLLKRAARVGEDVFSVIRQFANVEELRIPVQAAAQLSNLSGGRYYRVELRPIGASSGRIIGGFGVFSGHPEKATRVYPLLTVDLDTLLTIAGSVERGGFQLVYGPQSAARAIEGTALALPVDKFTLLLNRDTALK